MADVRLRAPAPDVIYSGPHGRPYAAEGDGTILIREADVDYMLGIGCTRIPLRDASGKFITAEPEPVAEPDQPPAPEQVPADSPAAPAAPVDGVPTEG